MTDYIFYATLFRKNETYNPTCLVLHSLRNVNGCFISVTLWRVYLLCCSDVLTSHTTGMCRSFSVSESTEKFVEEICKSFETRNNWFEGDADPVFSSLFQSRGWPQPTPFSGSMRSAMTNMLSSLCCFVMHYVGGSLQTVVKVRTCYWRHMKKLLCS